MQNHWEVIAKGGIVVSNTPEELWENAVNYFRWCDENPIKTKIPLTSGRGMGQYMTKQSTRPYTIKGLCIHCGILQEYLSDLRNSKDKNSLYYIVVSRIIYIIYTQNQEMAMIGEFSPVFTAKVLNMEKDETPVSAIKVEIVDGLPPLSTSENEVLEKLVLENGEIRNVETEVPQSNLEISGVNPTGPYVVYRT